MIFLYFILRLIFTNALQILLMAKFEEELLYLSFMLINCLFACSRFHVSLSYVGI